MDDQDVQRQYFEAMRVLLVPDVQIGGKRARNRLASFL